MTGPMAIIARNLFRYRVSKNARALGGKRFHIWRDLGIGWSTNVNPVESIPSQYQIHLPENLKDAFLPDDTRTIEIQMAKEEEPKKRVVLDLINDDIDNTNLKNTQGIVERLVDKTESETDRLWIGYLQAARDFFKTGELILALRCFINCDRVSRERFPNLDLEIGDCLVELGYPQKAAPYYIGAAEKFLPNGEGYNAADAYERAGLAWEAKVEEARPEMAFADEQKVTTYDSTTCFRKAKNHFHMAGDYDSESRCFVLERDAHRRWTPSMLRRVELSFMRELWLYGESPFHAFLTILAVWLVFAFAFFFTGFKSGDTVINYDIALDFDLSSIRDFATSLYFSAVTMSTLGYGDYSPASNASMFLAGSEAFLGILLGAMFLVSLQRRFVGR